METNVQGLDVSPNDAKRVLPAVDYSDRYRNIKTEENYMLLLKSGMFWEFHPELTGNWCLDEPVINGN